jgi:hypothetical protein
MTYKVLVTSVIKKTSFNERTSNSLGIPIPLLPSQPRDFNFYKLSFKNPANTLPLFYEYHDRTLIRVSRNNWPDTSNVPNFQSRLLKETDDFPISPTIT